MKKITILADIYPVVIINKRNHFQVMPKKKKELLEDQDAFLVAEGIAKLKDKTFVYVGEADWQPRN